MCQWKFLVLRYRVNRSARRRLSAPEMSLVASAPRFVGVFSPAARRDFASAVTMIDPSPNEKSAGTRTLTGVTLQHSTVLSTSAAASLPHRSGMDAWLRGVGGR